MGGGEIDNPGEGGGPLYLKIPALIWLLIAQKEIRLLGRP